MPYAGKPMKVRVDLVDGKMKPKAITQMIEELDLSPLEPLNVCLTSAEVTFLLICDPEREMIYFGRLVGKTRISNTNSYFQNIYDNKERPYQAPTSLDHELAFIVANMAQVRPYDLVYDPFVGSASTLISCAHFKALTFGSDLDQRVIAGTSIGRKTYNEELSEKVI